VLHEAAEQARRVENAPVVLLTKAIDNAAGRYCGYRFPPSVVGSRVLLMREEGREDTLPALRTAVADYMASEGCSCCRGDDHEQHADRLGELLGVPKYDDGSGRDFSKFRTK
jgi:hypothetical protein